MPLDKYHNKRKFKETPEPKGRKYKKKTGNLLYVIQQHDARNLHFDLRLEMDGVLKSWAIPKGPSLDPKVKRLAVHVEDHPLEYGAFEGVIPKGHYGAGVVTIWDKGEWECLDGNTHKAYNDGHLTVLLKGKKLRGLWKLVRIKSDPNNWLFMKMKDDYVEGDKLNVTGTKSKMPTRIHPQLATLVDNPPLGNDWLHEVKFDGYRLLSFINKTSVKLLTRNNHNWTRKFKALANELIKLKLPSVIFDGELVAINDRQQYDFQLLQNLINDNTTDLLYYYVFDILYYNGNDLTELSQLKRKEICQQLLPDNDGIIRYSEHIIGEGDRIYKKACRLGLEGIISKEINSPYIQKRTDSWLKSKCTKSQEFIVCGFTKPKGGRQYFGSLLLGIVGRNNKIVYAGHVGTGFNEKSLAAVARLLKKVETSKMPFDVTPPDSKDVTWVKPSCIVEVQYTAWTQDKILRHPSFKGILLDKDLTDLRVDKPRIHKSKTVALSNPEKIIYPKLNITKFDVAQYYERVSDWILPHLINRPLTLLRCPQGIEKECFYQRHLAEVSIESIYPVDIPQKKNHQPYLYIKDQQGLMSLIQLGVLEIHPWGVHIDKSNKPDVIIFDLDPAPDVEWQRVVKAAYFIRDQLEQLDLISFVKTTGGKGLHITIPIKRLYSWQQVQHFSQAFSETLAALDPDSFVSVMTKAKRSGKIYVDYLRNQQGATAIAPYSIRIHPEAPIATPLSWDELSAKVMSNSYTLKNIFKRLDKLKSDPWHGYFHLHQTLKFI